MRPAGVVSKKLIGLRKIAIAIFSCSFRDACVKKKPSATGRQGSFAYPTTYLNGAENPEDQSLDHNQGCGTNSKCEIDPHVSAYVRILARRDVGFGPLL
jgi:hypothetical protein